MRLLLNVVIAGTIVAAATASDTTGARAAGVAPARDTRVRVGVDRVVQAPADSVREYRGLYETGFEVSWFHPCDAPRGDDTWWVTLTDVALRQRDSLAATLPAGRTGPVFVRWRGTTSMKMPAGHGGRGSRYMLVTEVLQVRPVSEAGCATA